jgi:hypothetical protein
VINVKPNIERLNNQGTSPYADAECGEAVVIDQCRDQCNAEHREAEQPKHSCRVPMPSVARPSCLINVVSNAKPNVERLNNQSTAAVCRRRVRRGRLD